MLRHLGWEEAADLVEVGIQKTISAGLVTADLQRLLPEAAVLSTTEFGWAAIHQMQSTLNQ